MTHYLVTKALAFATKAHEGMFRKWSGEPYIEHPKRVAVRLSALGFGPEVIAAAFLHDVVEDTATTGAELAAAFGPAVAALVAEVTKPIVPGGNRAARKAAFRAHLAGSSYAGASIKLSDEIDNSSDVAEMNPRFAKVYLPEMCAELAVLGHGHPELVTKLTANITAGLAKIAAMTA
jgi:(p)ppGpp synthase/HD superfamily hydrolase